VQQVQEIFSELNESVPSKATSNVPPRLMKDSIQLVTRLRQQRIPRFRSDGIEEVADLASRWNLMDTENRLRIVPVVELLHTPLIVQTGFA
jgi:hypothetical protein